MSARLCLASCFLPLNADNCQWWHRLREDLSRQGLDLVLISATPPQDPSLPVITVPLWLHGFGQAYKVPTSPITLEQPLAQALASRDRSWSKQENRDLAEFYSGLAVCQHVLRTLLKELQPAAVMVWGSSLPQSVVLQHLAIQHGIPCWVLERGLLPRTLMVEMAGNGGCTELNWSFSALQGQRFANTTHRFTAAQQALRNADASIDSRTEGSTPESVRRKLNPDGRRIIAALLQHDLASGLIPTSYLGSKIHAPGIGSSTDLIRELARILAQEPDCRLIVKPHPMDTTDYTRWDNGRIRIARDVQVGALMEAADVVVCMTSTTQFEAVLREKPVVLLARSALSGKGIAYETKSSADLLPAVRLALLRDRFEDRMSRGRRFLDFVLSQFLIHLDSNASQGPSLQDLARFLADNALPIEPNVSLSDRLLAARDLFTLWEGGDLKAIESAENACEQEQHSTGETEDAPATARILPGVYPLELYRVRNRSAFEEIWTERYAGAIAGQQSQLTSRSEPFSLPGYCVVCGGETRLTTDFLFSRPDSAGRLAPAWRERQICECGLNCRQRSCFHILVDALGLPRDADIYCTEQNGALFRQIRRAFPRSVGSEFLGDQIPLGGLTPEGIRNEDITRLTFRDSSLDCIFSLDVLEHVPQYQAALSEFARCLKPGGRLLLTVPFDFAKDATVVRASVRTDGTIEHHLPPVHRGESDQPQDTLCFHEFGWDLLDAMREAGFNDVAAHIFTAPAYGYIGLQYVLLGTRRLGPRAHSTPRRANTSAAPARLKASALPSAEDGLTHLRQAVQLLNDGQWHSAAIAARAAHRLLPDSIEALQILAEILQRQHAWEDAGAVLVILTRKLPDDLAAWKARVDCARKAGHQVLTELVVEEAVERHPEWAPVLKDSAPRPTTPPPTPTVSLPSSGTDEEASTDLLAVGVEGRGHDH
ncbi:MAG: methyltransferase domain-containing protein [Verrucomicrobiales bacterium]|nr:methyltransferase domain-containing protein [Verrucomicrobiales bacterium]